MAARPANILVKSIPQIVQDNLDSQTTSADAGSEAGSASPVLSVSGSTYLSSGPQTPVSGYLPSSQPPSPFPWSSNKPDLEQAANRLSSLHLNLRSASQDSNNSLNQFSPSSPLLTPRAVSTWSAQLLSRSKSSDGNLLSPTGTVEYRDGLRTPSGFEHLDYGADYFSGQQAGGSSKRVPRSFEWELWGETPMPSLNLAVPNDASSKTQRPASPELKNYRRPSTPDAGVGPIEVLKRRLGPNEVSYYLGSRGGGQSDPFSGVNDMYLHVGFKAPAHLVTPQRVLKIWTELRCRHTLLTSSVDFEGFEEVRFVHVPLRSYRVAEEAAKRAFEFRNGVEVKDILDEYLNGPRTLSDDMLAKLMITTETPSPTSSPKAEQAAEDDEREYNFWLFATHFLGDGMALHTTANEFFELLGGGLEKLQAENKLEWDVETELVKLPPMSRLPPAMEARINTPSNYGKMAWAAARVEFQRNQGQLIGGQTFPRAKLGMRKTLVPTVAFPADQTSKILKACKAGGVTIAHAVFALANIAHIKVTGESGANDDWNVGNDKALPMMLYSALNLRGNMAKGPEEDKGIKPDFFHLVIGYYNVILPAFKPAGLTLAQTFWSRARSTKAQTVKAVKSPWLAQRSKLMSLERERRAIGFEREDERRRKAKLEKARSPVLVGAPPVSITQQQATPQTASTALSVASTPSSAKPKSAPAPSLAFLGVSMLGNLDGMYKHATFPDIKLHTLTTGSRQRPGAMLLFAYTLAGRLFLSLGYDVNAYPEGSVEAFWQAMLDGVQEFLVNA